MVTWYKFTFAICHESDSKSLFYSGQIAVGRIEWLHICIKASVSQETVVTSIGRERKKMVLSTELIKSNYNPKEIEKRRFSLPVLPRPSSAFFSWQCLVSSVTMEIGFN